MSKLKVAEAIKVLAFVGARPNMPKIATVQRAFTIEPLSEMSVQLKIVHTGQHCDPALSSEVASALELQMATSSPLSSNSDADALGKLMVKVEGLLLQHQPDLVLVFGDVNSTVAAAVVAARNGLPVAHIEAGLRSNTFEPEEINRKLVTACAEYHFTSTEQARQNLINEGVPLERIHFIGNTLTESFLVEAARRQKSTILKRLGIKAGGYTLLSVHKPTTTSNIAWLRELIQALAMLENIVWVVHPHTRQRLQKVAPALLEIPTFKYVSPLPYHDFGRLAESAHCIVTDSAGTSEEATVAGTACVTIGVPTARPETVSEGTNTYAGFDIHKCVEAIQHPNTSTGVPTGWDTRVSSRAGKAISQVIAELEASTPSGARWKLRED